MPEESVWAVHIALCTHFDKMIIERIGLHSVPGDFPTGDLTPEHEHYHGHTIEDAVGNAYEEGLIDDNDLDPLPTPEAGEYYISAEMLLPPWVASFGKER